jgi:hypothetical protein
MHHSDIYTTCQSCNYMFTWYSNYAQHMNNIVHKNDVNNSTITTTRFHNNINDDGVFVFVVF